MKWFHKKLKHLPLLAVILISLIIAFQNIDPNSYYSGWDNIHAEFNLAQYAKRIFFGSWLEHQGLGAPAGLSHLSEITRLPIVWLLKTLLPDNLVRYIFIFLMYLTGGIGTYLYLSKIWLDNKTETLKNWLASLGAIFYLLHILTLQQFYISFEMFTVQFAFLPFLLLTIHLLIKKINPKNILLFILIQLLIAPSGHTSTVFYLGTLFSLIYSFFIYLDKNKHFLKAFKFSLLIGLITLLTNSYWILPNLYYGFHNSEYVQQSHDNQLFGPESLWSIREAGNLSNLLKSTHYLFTWKDYSFANQKHELIFNEWKTHLSEPLVSSLLKTFGIITIVGLILTTFDKKNKFKRWGIVLFYLFCLFFIWIDLLPTEGLMEKLFQSHSFLETFRNPFTKFSIIYSFVSLLLFIKVIEFITQLTKNKAFIALVLITLNCAIIYTAWPSFQGHFISEKLQIKYPDQYQKMFKYLQTRNENLRILQLPQFSHAGWENYDWSFITPGNGYQGMGFYFFGFPQPFLNRDSDRWIETSDFFYHELKYALNNQSVNLFSQVLKKYNVDLIIIDETKINPAKNHDYDQDHELALQAGLNKVWEQDWLTIYERQSDNKNEELLIPNQISFISAETDRVKNDSVYQHEGNYVLDNRESPNIFYPFSNLFTKQLANTNFTENTIEITQKIPKNNYTISVPGLSSNQYYTPIAIKYQNQTVKITFPANKIITEDQTIILPKLADLEFETLDNFPEIIIFFNQIGVRIDQGQTVYPVISLAADNPISIFYTNDIKQLELTDAGDVSNLEIQATPILELDPIWEQWKQKISYNTDKIDQIKLVSEFPTTSLDLLQNPSINCTPDERGSINTQSLENSIVYQADNYGVSCNGYNFDYLSPAYSYILNITGENYQGRSTKFFINYSDEEIIPDDYLMTEGNFNSFLTLHKVSGDPKSRHFLNWETRSFGKKSINELSKIKIGQFPLDQMAQIKLEHQSENKISKTENKLEILSHRKYLDSIHKTKVNCHQEKCYLALDQSYDDLWLGFKIGEYKFLPHYRLNNWANLWEVSSGQIIIFYLPELVSLLSLGLVSTGTLIILIKYLKSR